MKPSIKMIPMIALFVSMVGQILAQTGTDLTRQAFADVSIKTHELLSAKQYAAAETFLKATLAHYPDDPRGRVWLLNCLGYVYESAGDYDRAESHYQLAISSAREALLGGDLDQMAPVSNLLSLYVQYGQTGKAERLRQKLDTIAPRWRTAEHPNTTRIYCVAAILEARLRHYKEAEPLLIRADQLLSTLKAARDADRAEVLNTLAMLYWLTDRRDRALETQRRSSSIASRNADGAMDPAHQALILVNLAVVELYTGHAEESKQHFEQGITLADKIAAPQDITTAEVLSAGAGYLKAVGLKREANQLRRRAATIRSTIAKSTSLGKTVDYQSFR